MSSLPLEPAQSRPAQGLKGDVSVPGDKSMSHRSLMFGTLAVGDTEIRGLLTGEDVMATAEAMRRLGAVIERDGDDFRVSGVGVGGLREPALPLDMGNSGTSTRLILGMLATHDLTAVVFGDASLNKRPMARVTDPLSQFGARFMARSGGRLPLAVQGTADAMPVRYVSPMASAQVKSAVLLAGLNAPGETTLIEPTPTRDHTERMLRGFGASVTSEASSEGLAITLTGQPELRATPVMVPGDPSSAAFLAVAGTIVPGSALTITNVMQNEHRTGLFQSLVDMGADLALVNPREVAGETVADVQVQSSSLKGCLIPADRAPSRSTNTRFSPLPRQWPAAPPGWRVWKNCGSRSPTASLALSTCSARPVWSRARARTGSRSMASAAPCPAAASSRPNSITGGPCRR